MNQKISNFTLSEKNILHLNTKKNNVINNNNLNTEDKRKRKRKKLHLIKIKIMIMKV